MTVFQSNSNARVAYKAQSALGSQAGATGAQVLRVAGGSGIKLSKAATESNEIRADGMRPRGRHGTQKTIAAYSAELSLGSHDPILEAIMRGTWDSSALTVDQTDMTSLVTGAHTLTRVLGSWIDDGFRVGDVVRASGLSDAANNGKNLRITGLTATVMTVAETLVVNAVPDTSCSITRPGKRLINPASLTKRYFTLEEYESDIDQSTVLTDFVFGQMKFTMSPNGLIMADVSGVGTGQIQALASGSSPYFTSPTSVSDTPMSVVDATVRLNGADLVSLTSLDLIVDITPSAPDVFGSGAIKYAPDVFTGQMAVSMNLGMLRSDLSILSDFIAETQYSLHILAVDNMSEPKDFVSIVVPNFTLGGADASALSKQGGGRTQTIAIPAALVGVDTAATGDNSMIKFQTTAA